MNSRIERHREMAEAGLKHHQGLTQAKIEGREPVTGRPGMPVGCVFHVTGMRETVITEGSGFGAPDAALRELRLYWHRIPDWGIKDYAIYPAEDGWIQFSYWGGTDTDGKKHAAWEAIRMFTDEDFNFYRVESIVDMKEWSDLVAFAQGREPGQFTAGDYADTMTKMR